MEEGIQTQILLIKELDNTIEIQDFSDFNVMIYTFYIINSVYMFTLCLMEQNEITTIYALDKNSIHLNSSTNR